MLRCIMTSRDDKPRGIDFDGMEAALKRAAYKAVHGTREERSGRYLPAKRQDGSTARRAPKQANAGRRSV
jgi:hypothetical protein